MTSHMDDASVWTLSCAAEQAAASRSVNCKMICHSHTQLAILSVGSPPCCIPVQKVHLRRRSTKHRELGSGTDYHLELSRQR